MTITKHERGKRVSYAVDNDNGEYLARFDTLRDAAMVVRYIRGGNMTEAESARVAEILENK